MDPAQKTFMIAVAIFIFISCTVATAIIGMGYFMQSPSTGGNVPIKVPSNANATNNVINNSYTAEILGNVSANGTANMTAEEVIEARERIKQENAIPLFVVKTKYGLNDDEINGVIDTYLTKGKDGAYEYILNLSDKHPEIAEVIADYNESGGDLGVIFG